MWVKHTCPIWMAEKSMVYSDVRDSRNDKFNVLVKIWMTADLLRKTHMSGVGCMKNVFVRKRTSGKKTKNKKKKLNNVANSPTLLVRPFKEGNCFLHEAHRAFCSITFFFHLIIFIFISGLEEIRFAQLWSNIKATRLHILWVYKGVINLCRNTNFCFAVWRSSAGVIKQKALPHVSAVRFSSGGARDQSRLWHLPIKKNSLQRRLSGRSEQSGGKMSHWRVYLQSVQETRCRQVRLIQTTAYSCPRTRPNPAAPWQFRSLQSARYLAFYYNRHFYFWLFFSNVSCWTPTSMIQNLKKNPPKYQHFTVAMLMPKKMKIHYGAYVEYFTTV